MGLSICKLLIEKMGGNVKVESKGIGFGTTFVIKLQAVSKIPRDVSIRHNLSKQKILNDESSQFKEQRQALLKSQLIGSSMDNVSLIEGASLSTHKVLIVNDEFFILGMLQQIV